MLGALRRSAKEASKTLGRASQLQQQRFLNIHEFQVRRGQRDCLKNVVRSRTLSTLVRGSARCAFREQN